MSDNITLPRELVFRAVKALTPMAYDTWPRERQEIVTALRTALAAEPPKPEPVAWQYKDEPSFDGNRWHENYQVTTSKQVAKFKDKNAQPLYAAPPFAHPGYVIGSHWLETAYSRICAGEAEADVLRDIGLMREEAFLTGVAHLKAENEALRREDAP